MKALPAEATSQGLQSRDTRNALCSLPSEDRALPGWPVRKGQRFGCRRFHGARLACLDDTWVVVPLEIGMDAFT